MFWRQRKARQFTVDSDSRPGAAARHGWSRARKARAVTETLQLQGTDPRQRIDDGKSDMRKLARDKRRAERRKSKKARQLKRAEQMKVWKREQAIKKQQRASLASARRIAQEQERQRAHELKVSAIQSHFRSKSVAQLIEICVGLHFGEAKDRPEQIVIDLLRFEVSSRGITQESIQLAILQIQQTALIESLDAIREQESKTRWGFGIGFGI
jgi:phenylalanyl-tRNA synthetase alpha subunit